MRHILLAILLGCSASLFAADRYVTTGGNDSNDGSVGSPWLTLLHAATNDNVTAGDTLHVAAGHYEPTVNWSNSGTAGSRILIVGTGFPSLTYFNNYGSNVTFQGFSIHGPGSAGSGTPAVNVVGDYGWVTDCLWTNYTWIRGVQMSGNFGVLSNNYFWHSNTAANADLRTCFATSGNGILVTRNTADHITDPEAMGLVWGNNNTISENTMTNCLNPGYDSPGTHGDFLQTWAYSSGAVSSNIVVSGNSVVNSDVQCWFINSANTGVSAVGTIRNWYIHNNIFANSWQSGGGYVPFVQIANNVFTNWGTANGYAFIIRVGDGDPYGFGTNCTVYNNIFLNAAGGGTGGSYARETSVGADYNHSAGLGYETKSLPDGTHNTTGDPVFRLNSVWDYFPDTGSPLINAGTNLSADFTLDRAGVAWGETWDIGAYQDAVATASSATATTANAATLVVDPP